MNKIILNFAAVVLFTAVSVSSFAQTPPDWSTNGNGIFGTEWFGALPNSISPVLFQHRANVDESSFEWYTTDGNLQEVMRLDRNGYLGVGALETRSRITIAPLSLVPGVNNGGYRAWMQEGIYMYSGLFNDGGSDNMYVGLKDEGLLSSSFATRTSEPAVCNGLHVQSQSPFSIHWIIHNRPIV